MGTETERRGARRRHSMRVEWLEWWKGWPILGRRLPPLECLLKLARRPLQRWNDHEYDDGGEIAMVMI